jgi:hypothetical protein
MTRNALTNNQNLRKDVTWVLGRMHRFLERFSLSNFAICDGISNPKGSLGKMSLRLSEGCIGFLERLEQCHISICVNDSQKLLLISTQITKKSSKTSQTVTNHKFCRTSSLVQQSITNIHKHKHTPSPTFVSCDT